MAQFGAAYTHRGELHGTAALSAVALLLGVAFGLSTLLTPLYLIYQQRFGFSRITLTLASRVSMLRSLTLMIPAAAAIVAAQVSASLWVMLVSTAVVAVATGLGYRGSLQVANQIAPADKRAAVVSSYFVCCFVGNALPVIAAGNRCRRGCGASPA
jgi:sugar phosphate permease